MSWTFYDAAGGIKHSLVNSIATLTVTSTFTLSGTMTSNLLFTDNTYDIGASGATRPRNLYLSGDATIGDQLFVNTGSNRTEATAQFSIAGSAYTVYHWLDATAYYIGQNSALRSLRMYSGATPTTGVELTNGATSWASTSDERLKLFIKPIQDATFRVSQMRHVIGRYKTDDSSVRRSFLVGQDVQAQFPEAVYVGANGILSLRYQDLIPLHGAAITELDARVRALEGK